MPWQFWPQTRKLWLWKYIKLLVCVLAYYQNKRYENHFLIILPVSDLFRSYVSLALVTCCIFRTSHISSQFKTNTKYCMKVLAHWGGVKNLKVGKCKMRGQILNNVTALISEQFLDSWLDDSSCAKSGKRILQKAEEILEPCNTPILSHCPQVWDWTHIILILVTGLISKQFSKSRSDHLSLAN